MCVLTQTACSIEEDTLSPYGQEFTDNYKFSKQSLKGTILLIMYHDYTSIELNALIWPILNWGPSTRSSGRKAVGIKREGTMKSDRLGPQKIWTRKNVALYRSLHESRGADLKSPFEGTLRYLLGWAFFTPRASCCLSPVVLLLPGSEQAWFRKTWKWCSVSLPEPHSASCLVARKLQIVPNRS